MPANPPQSRSPGSHSVVAASERVDEVAGIESEELLIARAQRQMMEQRLTERRMLLRLLIVMLATSIGCAIVGLLHGAVAAAAAVSVVGALLRDARAGPGD
jgi:hypothetical protein